MLYALHDDDVRMSATERTGQKNRSPRPPYKCLVRYDRKRPLQAKPCLKRRNSWFVVVTEECFADVYSFVNTSCIVPEPLQVMPDVERHGYEESVAVAI